VPEALREAWDERLAINGADGGVPYADASAWRGGSSRPAGGAVMPSTTPGGGQVAWVQNLHSFTYYKKIFFVVKISLRTSKLPVRACSLAADYDSVIYEKWPEPVTVRRIPQKIEASNINLRTG